MSTRFNPSPTHPRRRLFTFVSSSLFFLLAATTISLGQIVLPSSGDIATIAGDGTPGYSGDGGAATSAEIGGPYAVAVDGSGNVYIADNYSKRVREVSVSTGDIATVAGGGTGGYTGDGGPAIGAGIPNLSALAVDSSGNMYIVDAVYNAVRFVSASTGYISTLVGGGSSPFCANSTDSVGDGCLANQAALANPSGIALDSSGNLFIADESDFRIRKVSAATGIISTVAGNGSQGYSGDGASALSAKLGAPVGVAVDASGNIFISDVYSNVVREVSASTGYISTFAGTGSAGYSGDGGAATSAKLNNPTALAIDSSGNVYITDNSNCAIRMVSATTGDIATVAGTGHSGYSGDGGVATSAQLNNPNDAMLDSSGNLYIADTSNYVIRVVAH